MITPNFKKFKIEAYKPGKSKVKKLKNVIKLSANESALGMSPKAKKIISNKNLNLDKYPDGKSQNLRKAISKAYKCNYEKIIFSYSNFVPNEFCFIRHFKLKS